ncbi:MAG TPA: hypothetical protein VGQ95_11475, partial [Chthoniobacterales bacterium]|nr:hypothetical protein [Chthoniobacterales bacterium]
RLSNFGLPLLPETYTARLVVDGVLLGLFGTLWWLFVVQIVWRGFASLWLDVRQWRWHNGEK